MIKRDHKTDAKDFQQSIETSMLESVEMLKRHGTTPEHMAGFLSGYSTAISWMATTGPKHSMQVLDTHDINHAVVNAIRHTAKEILERKSSKSEDQSEDSGDSKKPSESESSAWMTRQTRDSFARLASLHGYGTAILIANRVLFTFLVLSIVPASRREDVTPETLITLFETFEQQVREFYQKGK
jgi:hypothetical protein